MAKERIYSPWGRSFHIMTKAAGASCNMRCDYCYYLDKTDLAPSLSPTPTPLHMSEELLELFTRDYIQSQPAGHPLTFTWHGGEATLRPISFYKKALDLQVRWGQGREIENTFQTNGMLITEEWCRFWRDHHILVGISLDGTERQHDSYRKTLGGGGSFARVMRGIEMLQRFGVEYNILSTVNNVNGEDPLEYYNFIKGIGARFIQFTPIVERVAYSSAQVEAPYIHKMVEERDLNLEEGVSLAPYSVSPEAWGSFTTSIFDEWVRTDVGEVFVQLFDATLAGWMGVTPGVCTLAPTCGHAGVIEHNGDVYSCDHYVYPRYRLGNIRDLSLSSMMSSAEQIRFGLAKQEGLTKQCEECLYLFACNGECPKNRFAYSLDGEPGHNYLCSGYYHFFKHVTPFMDYMKDCLLKGLPPSLVMDAIARHHLPSP